MYQLKFSKHAPLMEIVLTWASEANRAIQLHTTAAHTAGTPPQHFHFQQSSYTYYIANV
jgi:hypothetical protein